MQVVSKKLSDTGVELTVNLAEADLAEVKRAVFNKLRAQVKADGFRPGKAPDNIVEQQLGSQTVQAEVVDAALNRTYPAAVAQENLQVIGQPEVALKKFVPYSELIFTALVEVMPVIKLPDYKKFKIEARPETVADRHVDEVLERMRTRLAEKKPVKRAAQTGDEVKVDFKGTDHKGVEVPGASSTDFPVTIGSQAFIPGFEEELLGLKAGEQKAFKVTFPKDYHAKALQGAKVNFDVTVKDVHEVIAPPLDDGFATKSSPFKTLTELRADVRKQLEAEFVEQGAKAQREELVKKLVEGSKLSVPPRLLDRVLDEIKAEFKRNLEMRGLTEEQFYQNERTTAADYEKTQLRPAADRRVKGSLVLSEVARVEQIDITATELEQTVEALKARYKDDPKTLDALDKPAAREDIAMQVLTERTIDKLLSYAGGK